MSAKPADIRTITICRICKKRLPLQLGLGRKRYYCSRACKIRAYRARKCSTLPRKARKRAPGAKGLQPTCRVCERPLCIPKTGRKPHYCSDTCRKKAYRKRQFRLREKSQHMARNPLKNFIHHTVEWHTPSEYIHSARAVLGEIELDPASCYIANQTVRATRFFDRTMDGLAQEWKARTVFLNPPHDRMSPITPWIDKLLSAFRSGNVQEALLLVDASTETQWFEKLYAFPLCFVRGRINFVSGEGIKTNGQIQGSVFVYLGQHTDTFLRVFEKIGRIYLPLSTSL
jgi:phage N-6-adenine-methyltransferase